MLRKFLVKAEQTPGLGITGVARQLLQLNQVITRDAHARGALRSEQVSGSQRFDQLRDRQPLEMRIVVGERLTAGSAA